MTLDEKLKRNEPEDQIEIGQIIEKATSGDFGIVLRLIMNGIVAEEIANSLRKDKISAERVLGRIEILAMLQERLDLCVDIKNQLQAVRRDNNRVG